MNRKINYIIDEIIDQYMYADETKRPWLIGFSGGKDSTVLLQLIWKALLQIKDFHGIVGRDIYVVSNDTMVENPIITEYVHRILGKIEVAARNQNLPIYVKKTIPRLEDSFWVNLIGKGYPTPNSTFRWCTDRLKIKPTSRFLIEQISEKEEAVLLIGTRKKESANRAKSMKKHSVKGKRLSKHPNHNGVAVYAPIRDLSLEEVWYIINSMASPWEANNEELFQIYSDASADDYECPTMVTTDKHKSCGQSRFGCWVCTVVKEDKSMAALIENGLIWLTPLLRFRNLLQQERPLPEHRMFTRRNKQKAVNKNGEPNGTYTAKYRATLLKRLLEAQKSVQEYKPHIDLITNQELIAIQAIWSRDIIFKYKVSEIYSKIYKSNLNMKDLKQKEQEEREILEETCEGNLAEVQVIQDLLSLQKQKSLMNRKHNLKKDLEARIEQYIKEGDA
ncbi:MAG: DNA phosphorothioation system sulfurtransferase DndC [Bacteroidota bacterium]